MTFPEEERAYLMDEISRLLALARKYKHEGNEAALLSALEDLKDNRHALAVSCNIVDARKYEPYYRS